MKYHKTGFSQISQNRFRDMYCPGIEPVRDLSGKEYMPPGLFKPSESFWTENHRQPYFKLHGSSNWRDGDSALLIMGGNKGPEIENNRLLRIYRNEFKHRISQPNSKLVIIGYSFQDSHINEILESAAKAGAKIFIIDLAGVDVLDSAVNTPASTQPYRHKIQDSIAGASRRQLQITFSTDHVERGKIWRFINRLGPEG
jgi:SIR2-like domain